MTFAEKEKAAAQAGRERADALRARLAATPEPLASLPATPWRDEPTIVSALSLLGKTQSEKSDGGSTNPIRGEHALAPQVARHIEHSETKKDPLNRGRGWR